ncbi:binding partner of ACD11 1-like [Iris pallida]|uniref:Binding partner of ACD11 1-like n=1 Tax=Iris pallida TaxID=29817 RepID=A0AAX6DHZ0_IRIPA|nr:binding partner of ACD11 1-like [Iris pallida]
MISPICHFLLHAYLSPISIFPSLDRASNSRRLHRNILAMPMTTVKVSNISLSASQQDIREFFSFSGDIVYVEMQSESEKSQIAYVTFKDSQGADTAVLLSGATIVDLTVTVVLAENYQLPPEAYKSTMVEGKPLAVQKAEDVMSSMLAKGFVLGKDALQRAKLFDERHGLTSNATATVASLDRRMGLSEKISTGTAVVNEKAREVDERFQVSQTARSALAAAEQKASAAGSALLSNPYVSTGVSWFSTALSRVANAAGDVTSMTREKVEKAEEEKKEVISRERKGMLDEFAKLHLDETYGEPAVVQATDSPTLGADRKLGSL